MDLFTGEHKAVVRLFQNQIDPAEFKDELRRAHTLVAQGNKTVSLQVLEILNVGAQCLVAATSPLEPDQATTQEPQHEKSPVKKTINTDSVDLAHVLDIPTTPRAPEPEPVSNDEGEDITLLSKDLKRSSISSTALSTHPSSRGGSFDLAAPETPITTSNSDASSEPKPAAAALQADDADVLSFYNLSQSSMNEAATNIGTVLHLWFEAIAESSKTHKKDLLPIILQSDPTKDYAKDLHAILLCVNAFIRAAVESRNLLMALPLRAFILLLHRALQTIYLSLAREQVHVDSSNTLALKKFLFAFFEADIAQSLKDLLDTTTGKMFHQNTSNDSTAETASGDNETQRLRLSYEIVMKIYAIGVCLCNCPVDLILVDKVSLSLDITTIDKGLSNIYSDFVLRVDFSSSETRMSFEQRVIPQLAAQFNYFHKLVPDLLEHSLKHSSFFGWVTGRIASGPYLSIKTADEITNFPDEILDTKDPYLLEVYLWECKHKWKHLKEDPESPKTVQCPSYLVLSFGVLQLTRNLSFREYMTGIAEEEKAIRFFDIWLCVSSYVHHYQYKSMYNTYGTRVSLLALLRLTSPRAGIPHALAGYKINEHKWKLCHHMNPVIQLDKENPIKSSLLYILDVLQVTFKFNLSKKLDLQNCKLGLTIMYQIFLEFEANPISDLTTYQWHDLYLNLVNFIRFVAKTYNEVDVQCVIEETFSVFEILLSPVFDKTFEKSNDFFSFGSHLAKSINFDLLYVILQQYEAIKGLFEKYITRTENYSRVEKVLQVFEDRFYKQKMPEMNTDEVVKILNELSILTKDTSVKTEFNDKAFNYADTFRYLHKKHDLADFESTKELIKVFNLVLDYEWLS